MVNANSYNKPSRQTEHVAKIQRGTHNDLRNAFLAVHASAIVMDIPELAEQLNIKRVYAKELMETLCHMEIGGNPLVHVNLEVGEPGNDGAHDLYSTFHTVDEKSSIEMEQIFDKAFPAPTVEDAEATIAKRPAPRTPQNATNPADLPLCLCGCGDPVTNRKRNYKPGHDARHAGNVARDMAQFPGMNNEERRRVLLDALPTDGLRWKAAGMADRLIAKGAPKKDRAPITRSYTPDPDGGVTVHTTIPGGMTLDVETGAIERVDADEDTVPIQEIVAQVSKDFVKPVEWESGEVKIGRWKYTGERNTTSGAVRYIKNGNLEVATQKIAATFTPGSTIVKPSK
jgi:hypothetical protein